MTLRMKTPRASDVLRSSGAAIAATVLVQAVVLGVGWFVVYNETHEQIGARMQGVIVDNNVRVAESITDLIGRLPDSYDGSDPSWTNAQAVVEQFDFGSGGFACIVDADSEVLCHPEISNDPSVFGMALGEYDVRAVGSTGTGKLRDFGLRGGTETGLVDFSVAGEHYVSSKPLTETGVRLFVHQPVSGVQAAASDVSAGLLARMVAVGAGVLLLTSAACALLITRHTRAIRAWNAELEGTVAARTRQLRDSREAIVFALAKLADYRDNETGQHVLRISKYAERLAEELRPAFPEIDDAWIERVRLASMLHDIGKVEVPDAVLRKPGRLTDDEFAVIQRHPLAGADTLLAVSGRIERDPLITMAVEISLYHHEKWDGAGYPYGLSGESIPLSARLTAVVDVFDALLSPRVYKPGMPFEKVCGIIRESAGSHFDPAIVEAFEACSRDLLEIFEANADSAATLAA